MQLLEELVPEYSLFGSDALCGAQSDTVATMK